MKKDLTTAQYLKTTRRYQITNADVIEGVIEVVRDAIENHQDVITHVFVNDKRLGVGEQTIGDITVIGDSTIPAGEVWISVPVWDMDTVLKTREIADE